ncbi:hypothetical protein BN1723_014178 [Verticillium longisporum]|uniref:Uncharacterized protein n=1 Tax=Verticillium longisporum TaxID=100787 RepID=A0A0G4M484_VERLO|nr:hypothetical protein BN1723_014178 [Verticillium longisporum]
MNQARRFSYYVYSALLAQLKTPFAPALNSSRIPSTLAASISSGLVDGSHAEEGDSPEDEAEEGIEEG